MADGLTRHLVATVERVCRGRQGPFEIEAKFGRLVDKQTGDRVRLPVLSECVIEAEGWTRFESELPMAAHKHLNSIFNSNCEKFGWRYKHLYLVDRWHRVGTERVRVTEDTKSGQVMQACVKERLADVAILMPESAFDVRISINVERSVEWPQRGSSLTEDPARNKDRLSYRIVEQGVCIDLTQVTQSGQVKHELEVEISDSQSIPNLIETIRQISFLI